MMKVLNIDEIVEIEDKYYAVRKEYDNSIKLIPCDVSIEEAILNKLEYVTKIYSYYTRDFRKGEYR